MTEVDLEERVTIKHEIAKIIERYTSGIISYEEYIQELRELKKLYS